MSRIVILGSGDFAREVYYHIKDTEKGKDIVFASDENIGFIEIDNRHVQNISNWKFGDEYSGFIVGVGKVNIKKILVEKALEAGLKPYPTIVHPRAYVQDADLGKGGIICPGVMMTTNIKIGDYVIVNLNCTVGHDSIIQKYSTINPGVNISGKVNIGEMTTIGTGSVIREGILVGDNIVVGAQAAVVKHANVNGGLYVGLPANLKN